MKIGILTLSLHTNYGGILQAYALVSVLEKMGHEVWLIDTQLNKVSTFKIISRKIKEIKKRIEGQTIVSYPSRKLKKRAYELYMMPFISKNIPRITETFDSLDTLGKKIGRYGFDAFVVGSDQIWNPRYFPHIEVAFFSFLGLKNEIRISYAPSFGTEVWKYSDEQTTKCKELVRQFDAVSVREDVGVEFCSTYLKSDATLVLDPTMLLSPQDYLKLLPQNKHEKRGELFTYVLDNTEKKSKIINSVAKALNYVPFNLEIIKGYDSCPLEWRTKETVEKWIQNFGDAKFIITDSFHGCVFSILFNKPFFVLINYERGAVRFKSLLSLFNLSDRILSTDHELSKTDVRKEIDWNAVNSILNRMRTKSTMFLKDNLICHTKIIP